MIDISVLYAGGENAAMPHRYGRAPTTPRSRDAHAFAVAESARTRKPIVVWNMTRTCNLKCAHCYSNSEARQYANELTTEEGKRLLEDLADFKVPAVLFSGGEPLTRPDVFELAGYARRQGLRVVFSTNGTLIDESVARRFRDADVTYVGISLDGMEAANDDFRGVTGAFQKTMRGFRRCVEIGQKVGLRLTLTRRNLADLERIFDLIEAEGVNRACFYHLVPTGRGRDAPQLAPAESRRAIDTILRRTRDFAQRGLDVEVLTVDNHCDGPYLYMKMLEEEDTRADEVYKMLEFNGGGLYSSGVGIACVDFVGDVHPDQFWMHYRLGNVRERSFADIWTDASDTLLAGLKDKGPRLKGRCRLCRFRELCGGALRVRADLYFGDPWAPDPACYLTDEEIGLTPEMRVQLKACGEDFSVPVDSPDAKARANALYPVYLDLTGRDVLVVGGGPVAARKVTGLLESGAHVTVVAPRFCAELDESMRVEAVTSFQRRYRRSDLSGKWLVTAATDDPELNKAISEDAARANVFCNVVDGPELCSFQVPAVCRRGWLQLAVSTGGASPALAKRIRMELEKTYGEQYGALLEGLRGLREHLRRKYPQDQARRRQLMKSFVDSEAPDLLLKNGNPEAFLSELERWKSL